MLAYGIRMSDGVQTCALPILNGPASLVSSTEPFVASSLYVVPLGKLLPCASVIVKLRVVNDFTVNAIGLETPVMIGSSTTSENTMTMRSRTLITLEDRKSTRLNSSH